MKIGILVKDALVRTGPSKIYDDSTLLPAGEKILVREFGNDWLLIEFPQKSRGWINKQDLKLF